MTCPSVCSSLSALSQTTDLLGATKLDDLQGKWEGHHIFPKWLMDDLGIDDVNPDHLPTIALPGGGTTSRHLWAPDPGPASKGFADMTNGLGADGKGYDAPFHRGKAPEGLEARLTSIRAKHRTAGTIMTPQAIQEIMNAMSVGPHGEMGLRLKFKSIFNTVVKAKGGGWANLAIELTNP